MTTRQDLIDELESAIAVDAIGRRAQTLRRITDLFLSGSSLYSEEEIDLFDEVMSRLCIEIETAARAALAERLAGIRSAPRRVMRNLAYDDAIEVAGPVLSKSPRLDDETLVTAAKTKGPDHLLAIAQRQTLAEAVTDALIERKDPTVTLKVVENPGARFSEAGYTTLVERSSADDQLAIGLWARTDVPRHHLVRLFAKASETVRVRLEALDQQRANAIRTVVAEVSEDIQARVRTQSRDYQAASALVGALHAAGELDTGKLDTFAKQRKFNETAVALSLLCNLPIGVIERGLVHERCELILVFAKAIGLGWDTTRSILRLRASDGNCTTKELDEALASFTKLKRETARKAVRFYHLREQTGNGLDRLERVSL